MMNGGLVMDKETAAFLIRAKRATYAGKGAEAAPSRPCSHDLIYREGGLTYIDSYLGGDRFAGEEALWRDGVPFWSMNYCGRVIGEDFSGDFLKEALKNVPEDMPYRGPEKYSEGYHDYSCEVSGNSEWFQGREVICLRGAVIYECFFHGGMIK